MEFDWSKVKPEHVLHACNLFDAGSELPLRPAKNTFLISNERAYPAKFILGTAYQLATGKRLDPSTDYSGGAETARRLRALGFTVQYEPDADRT
jgi:hypothetical protein